jgi:hypothetical protein
MDVYMWKSLMRVTNSTKIHMCKEKKIKKITNTHGKEANKQPSIECPQQSKTQKSQKKIHKQPSCTNTKLIH